MIEVIPDMPHKVVAISAKGTVTGEDYDNVLIPAIEEKLDLVCLQEATSTIGGSLQKQRAVFSC